MPALSVGGPPGPDNWQTKRFALPDDDSIVLLVGPDSVSDAMYVLLPEPILVHSSRGAPQFSLSLVLNRQPDPGEASIRGLVERGQLTIEVQVGVPEETLSALTSSGCGPMLQRLFIRQVDYVLLWHDSPDEPSSILGQAQASGSLGRVAMSVNLSREQTLAVLDALERQTTSLKLEATVKYRITKQTERVCLSGAWAAIHDFLNSHLTADGILTEAVLHTLLPEMVAQPVLAVTYDDGRAADLSAERLVQLFMRQGMVVLQREPAFNNLSVHYRLRPRPHPSFLLNYREAITTEQLASIKHSVALENVLGNVLSAEIWDAHVNLVAADPVDPARLGPVPRRVRSERSRRITGRGKTNRLPVAVLGSRATSLTLATQPTITGLATRPQLATAHLQAGALNHVMIDDLRLELYKPVRVYNLPVVDDIGAPYWRDRVDRKRAWYAPTFEVVIPDSADNPAGSPFLFSFTRQGVTNTGQPALNGEVHFTIRQLQNAETAAALRRAGIRDVRPVPLGFLAVNLLVPFVDANDGRLKQHRFTATVSRQGETLVASVELLNEWVRLCYGALAIAGFQAAPARIQIAYTFASYVVVRKADLELAFGGKALHTPVVYSALEAARLRRTIPYFDAVALTYIKPEAEVRYQRESLDYGADRVERQVRSGSLLLARPELAATRPVASTPAPVHPQLTLSPNVAELLKKVKYAHRSHARRHTLDIMVPCNRLGRFYQEIRSGEPVAIGCQDALKLGETRYQQYEEIAELSDSAYRVYRSLPQPGHFLIVPERYCISRRAPGESDAYRPLIFLNALFDPEVAANNRVELRTTLQPDLPPYTQRALVEKLKSYDPLPTLHYPTDLSDVSAEFHWALDPSITASSEADVINASGPYISVYLRMDLASWQLMRDVLTHPGVTGSVVITLGDNSRVSSSLLLKLDQVRGPWDGGPLEVHAEAGHFNLLNRIERTLDVSDLVRYAGAAVAQRVHVEVSLRPDESHTVNAPADLIPVYSYPPGDPVAIDEVRSFVEEIYSNLIFINLLNFANHNLLRLDIEAQVRGVGDRYTAQLTQEMPVADIPIILSLTTYLEQHILEFRVTKIFQDRPAEMTDWMLWDLDTTVPVSITSALVGL